MKTEKSLNSENEVVIYQTKDGSLELKADINAETVWATQKQIAEIFGTDRTVITRHIKNIFKDVEVDEKSNVQKIHIPNSDKPVSLYSLDIILAVGYRTNSKLAINFRQWATKTLKNHITKGYTLNEKLLKSKSQLFQQALTQIQNLSKNQLTSDQTIELIKYFSSTWFSLDAFDKESIGASLKSTTQTKNSLSLDIQNLYQDLELLKQDLIQKNQATDLFAKENAPQKLESVFKNIYQTAFGTEVYPTVEQKAANLLYFIVKNHPFVDGNKRSGAFAFIWFLRKNNFKFSPNISPQALTALTLLIATSDPSDKNRMIDLVNLLLTQNQDI